MGGVALPAPRRTPDAARGDAVRRRTANGGDRPGLDEPAAVTDARRTVPGPRAEAGPRGLPGHPADQCRRRRDRTSGGTKRPSGLGDRPPRLRLGNGPDHTIRTRDRPAPGPRDQPRVPRNVIPRRPHKRAVRRSEPAREWLSVFHVTDKSSAPDL